jgi:hypothetical protein
MFEKIGGAFKKIVPAGLKRGLEVELFKRQAFATADRIGQDYAAIFGIKPVKMDGLIHFKTLKEVCDLAGADQPCGLAVCSLGGSGERHITIVEDPQETTTNFEDVLAHEMLHFYAFHEMMPRQRGKVILGFHRSGLSESEYEKTEQGLKLVTHTNEMIDEAATEYFLERYKQITQKAPPHNSGYDVHKEVMRLLVAVIGEEALKNAYFFSGCGKLKIEVDKKLNIGAFDHIAKSLDELYDKNKKFFDPISLTLLLICIHKNLYWAQKCKNKLLSSRSSEAMGRKLLEDEVMSKYYKEAAELLARHGQKMLS